MPANLWEEYEEPKTANLLDEYESPSVPNLLGEYEAPVSFAESVNQATGGLLTLPQDIGRGFVRGAGRLVESIGGALEMASEAQTRPLRAMGLKPPENLITKAGQALHGLVAQRKTGVFDPANPTWWAESLPEIAPQLAAQIGLAAVSGGASVIQKVASFAGSGGAMMAGTQFNDALAAQLAKGVPEPEARDKALSEAAVVGTLGAALEAIPGMEFLTQGPVAKLVGKVLVDPRVINFVARGGTESLTELGQELVAILSESNFRDEKLDPEKIVPRLKAAATLGVAAGSGVSVMLDSASAAPEAPAESAPPPATVPLSSPTPTPEGQTAPLETNPPTSLPVPVSPPEGTTKSGQVNPDAEATRSEAWARAKREMEAVAASQPPPVPPLEPESPPLIETAPPSPEIGSQVEYDGQVRTVTDVLTTDDGRLMVSFGDRLPGDGAIDYVHARDTKPVAAPQPLPSEPAAPPVAPTPPTAEPDAAPPAIGVRNAITDQIAAAMGLPARVTPETQGAQVQLDEAQAAVHADPARGSTLVAEVNAKPRILNTLETNIVLYELAARKTAYNNAVAEANAATDPETKAQAQERMRGALEKVQEVIEATRAFGTEQGRALEARKRLIDEQYELPVMLATAQASKGEALNQAESDEITDLWQKINDSQKRIEELEAQVASQASADLFAQLVAETKKQAAESAKVEGGVEAFIKRQADAARKRIRDRSRTTFADPLGIQLAANIADHAIVGAEYIASGIKKLAAFTTKLVEEFGEAIRPQAKDIFEASNSLYNATQNAAKGPRTRQKSQPADVAARLAQDAEKGTLTHRTAYEVVKQQIESGVEGFDAVMQAATDQIAQVIPGVTISDVRTAFSEYGKTQFPSKEKLSQQLSEYRRLAQLQEAIEDARSGKAPKKSGMQRNKPTQAVREKMAELRKAMDEAGIDTQSSEDQIASRNQARATALRNQIEDFDKRLQGGPKREKGQPVPDSPEVDRLRAERDAMREELDRIEADADPAAADADAIQRTEEQIAELDQRLQEGDLSTRTRAGRAPSPELERLRAQRKAMQQQLDRMRREAQPKQSEDERWLAQAKKAIDRRIKETQRRIREGDFSKPAKKVRPTDAELEAARFENAKAKEQYARLNFERELANQSLPKKILRTGAEIANTARAVMTSMDLSALLRQGGFIGFAHPVRAAKSIPAMLRAFASERNAFKVNEEIQARPNAPLYKSSGLYLADQDGTSLSKMEEAYMSRWAQKIPLVAGSARAYTTFLNKLRADSFDAMAATLSPSGKPTPEESKAIANFINVATGRAPLGRMEVAGQALATAFFSPRFVASRFQLLAGQPFYGGNKRTRQLVAKEYGRFLIGLGVVYALLAAAQDDDDPMIEGDPRSSDFGKIRFGETRVDPLAGLAQVTTFLSRELSGETKNLKGKVTRLREDMRPLNLFRDSDPAKKDPFGSDGGDVASRFLRTKLAPVPGAIANLMSGRNIIGEETSLGGEAMNTIIPLSFREIAKTMEEQGVPRGSVLTLLSLLGMGVNTYAEKEKEKN